MDDNKLAGQVTTDTGDAEDTATVNDVAETPETTEVPEATETAEAAEGQEKQGAPEAYEEFKVPEGMPYDTEAAQEFGELAKELNLTQDQAQKLVDTYAKKQASRHDSLVKHLETMKESWVGDIKKEWGDSFDKQAAMAAKGAELGDESLMDLLNGQDKNLPGIVLADHPAMARFLAKVGQMTSESSVVEGTPAGRVPKSVADTLYGTVDIKKE